MKSKPLLLLLLFLFSLNFSLFAAQPEFQKDYKLICDTFKNATNSPVFKNLNREQSIEKINDIIWKNIKTKEAKDMLSVIASASPDKKYDLLKQTIEVVTEKKWDCPAMRDY